MWIANATPKPRSVALSSVLSAWGDRSWAYPAIPDQDEAGYLLVPEGGSWGNGTSAFHAEHFPRQLQDTIRACRNHPCVARYSMANESLPSNPESPSCAWRALIAAAADPIIPTDLRESRKWTGS